MNVRNTEQKGVHIISIEGRFDAFGVEAVTKMYETIIDGDNPKVVVDLQDVTFIDSIALATLVKGLKRTRERNGEFALCNLQQAVLIIFELTRLDLAFKIYKNRAAALEVLGN